MTVKRAGGSICLSQYVALHLHLFLISCVLLISRVGAGAACSISYARSVLFVIFFCMQNNILCVGILLLVTCICLIIVRIVCTVCLLYQLQATGGICLPSVVSAWGIYICVVCLCRTCMSVCVVV